MISSKDSRGFELRQAYCDLLRRLVDAPIVASVRSERSIGSSWGTEQRPFRELIGERITIGSNCVLLSSCARPINLQYAVISSAWIILGRNDVTSLEQFNRRGSAFTQDGFTLSGAFGFRLRSKHGDQLEAAITMLSNDPSSRRAVAFVGDPKDIIEDLKDCPCASLVQFFLRGNVLNMLVFMRSQSLFGVFPYDVVNFRYLQIYVAWRLQCEVGSLEFIFGSLHVYEEEITRINQFLADQSATFVALPPLPWRELAGRFSEWTEPNLGPERLSAYLAAERYE